MRFVKTAATTSVLSIAAVCVILIAGGPVGCDTTGPDDGPTFPGNSTGTDDREVLIFSEEWDPTNPVWSPTCDRVAFEKSYGGYRVICIYDVTTDTYKDLSTTAPAPLLADWSHNGEWIQYGTTNTWDVYVIKPDGSDNTLIYDCGGSTGVFLEGSFSPDDREIAFESGSGAVVLNISDLGNIERRNLDPWPDDDIHMVDDTGGCWSPGGEYIALLRTYWWDFFDVPPAEYYVYVTDPQGESYDIVLHEPSGGNLGTFMLLDWSPDGRYLLLIITSNGLNELWAYELKTGEYTQITYGQLNQYDLGGADWGNNGKIVFEVFDYKRYHDYPNGPWHIIYTIDAP